ncbi:dienelactone hydrolase family protein [Amycolatopsis palatopharyngis]|uniref:dienelactone hydrolase family protein n=1 Tax=Amycolatopsis palatopharyngis TaxID=187982 RepID=UPI000E22B040|nr:alpha/beta hydrolase [Amycolatopsis palatopharyngis]
MAPKPKRLLEQLQHPGPHEVLRGDLALVGLPGVVFTPTSGLNLPAVVFGHGWMQSPDRYLGLLRHLASWGIVAAAPATQHGPVPSHRLFAADLHSTLDILTGVRLGPAGISVDPAALGLAGHSIGGGAAVLAAAEQGSRIKAVATIAAAQTVPPASEAARSVEAPGLHLVPDDDLVTPAAGNAEVIARAWGGPVQLRTIAKSSHLGVTEGRHWSQLLLHGKPHRPTQRLVRALFAGFFLTHLTSDDSYRPLLDADLKQAAIFLDSSQEPAAT